LTLQGNDGGRLDGRTMEFGQPLNSNAVLIQRGTAIQGNGPDGKSGGGLQWTSRYGVVGLNALGLKDVVPDGMNEMGLAGGLLSFAGCARFQNLPPGQATIILESDGKIVKVPRSLSVVIDSVQGSVVQGSNVWKAKTDNPGYVEDESVLQASEPLIGVLSADDKTL
jgi:choloylglycine hydrolase